MYCQKHEKKQDGRKAFLAVQQQCEGTAAMTARKNRAYASISTAVFKGAKRNYSFQDYITTHAKAHAEIKHCNKEEEITESKKVTDFLFGIQDSSMESTINHVYRNTDMLNNFELCQKYLATTKIAADNLNRAKGSRNIAAVQEKGRGKKGKGKLSDGFQLEDKRYPFDIYRLLSNAQKKQLKEWADSKSLKRRKVKSLKQESKGDGDDNQDSSSEEDEPEEQAGRQFGRKAHKKAKQSKR